ncbi:hypothetical protein [Microbacterium sp. CPCC 204701]|uniref:hypothetical protein n=1 Tax=Microbacterium sp. CPCC 204701 TaxID=2493084 RepID=UPI000FD82A1B|nr:hypothetical protein [Microbacterium sp. CPCC 204701]
MHHPLTIEAMVVDQIIRGQHADLRRHGDPRWDGNPLGPPARTTLLSRIAGRLRRRGMLRPPPGAAPIRAEA